MVKEQEKSDGSLRPANSPKDSYHDLVFEEEINEFINLTKAAYDA